MPVFRDPGMLSYYRIPLVFLVTNLLFLLFTFSFKLFDEKRRYQVLFVQFVLFYQGGLLLISRFLWRKFTSTFPIKSVLGLSCRLILAPLTVLAQGCMILHFFLASTEPGILIFASGYSLIALMTIFGIVLVVDFGRLLIHALGYRREINKLRGTVRGEDVAHRLAWHQLSKRTEGLGLCIVLVISAYTLVISNRRAEFPNVKRIELPIRNLPASFDGFTIVQLTDLHVGGVVGRQLVRKLVSVASDLKPDLFLFTGDLAESTLNAVREAVKPLSSLSATYGSYFTPGNHDYYTTEIDKWVDYLDSIRIKPLRNERIEIRHVKFKHDFFYLVGLDDPDGTFFRGPGYGPNYSKPLTNRNEFTPTILISHRPSTAKHAIKYFGNIQLALAGHTHGGQVFPVLLWHYFTEPYFNGLYQLSPDTYIYVSPGVFYYAAPLRFLTRGEITHITLTLG